MKSGTNMMTSSAQGYNYDEILKTIYNALKDRGYDPIMQITGFLIAGDPTYITSYNGARKLVTFVDRERLLATIVDEWLQSKNIKE